MDFLAHTENIEGRVHRLSDHLVSVGELAGEFIKQANPELSEIARWAGLLHDLGKYKVEFQDYLLGRRERSAETHHAVYGAALAYHKRCIPIAFVVAGHHRGLHDTQSLRDMITHPQYDALAKCSQLAKLFSAEIEKIPESLPKHACFSSSESLRAEFAIRMIFSALVDADFLDTEAHYLGRKRPALAKLEAERLLSLLDAERQRKSTSSRSNNEILNQLRNKIFSQCVEAGAGPQGFYSLTVPTGGGKTISSMAFALAHAARHGLRRVIVVIPYLSIIEQNSTEYRSILDPDNSGIVIENHSAVWIPAEAEEERSASESRERNPLVLAAENWDAPIVVTTSVQFLESLLANRPSKCRKLHNIARSVVIFDEVQTMPQNLLRPLLSVFRELKENYGVTFLFSTATQPAFRKQFNLPNGFDKSEVSEIIADPEQLFSHLRRVQYKIEISEPLSFEELARKMSEHEQVLVVVNTRSHAFELFEATSQYNKNVGYHLSSAMCPQHRLDTLQEIRKRLACGRPCSVVSTQLVEAGVDLDFPVVFRALGPLDSIVQAAGRCNREGRCDEGIVYVFKPRDHRVPPGVYHSATERTAMILADIGEDRLATDPTIFADYFTQIFANADAGTAIEQERLRLNFQTVAENSKVIRDDGRPVIVPYKNAMKLVENLRSKKDVRGELRFSLRQLQRFMVNLRSNEFDLLKANRLISPLFGFNGNGEPIGPSLWLLSEQSYDATFGVLIDRRPSTDFIL
ncbi:MAG: CRISPR-associated helicase Cas3' [Pyrinomonadaceae bacterium]